MGVVSRIATSRFLSEIGIALLSMKMNGTMNDSYPYCNLDDGKGGMAKVLSIA